ncbi:hypothetical protein ACIHFE_29585 [Streptomyces sp. NPDC052396]|uniref:hypothetical protein n=1 Tax=Streptomyces sp. NPDC052396 TaxID=3365689 RepID=UPI0037D2C33D
MGSLRNPIGPLPSSIYWRRRGVVLALGILLVLLTVWLLSGGDGGGSRSGKDDGAHGKPPTEATITPGPTPSGPQTGQRPGGRDESTGGPGGTGGSGGSGGGSGPGGGGTGGSGGGPAAGVLGAGNGRAVPAGSPMPDCTPGALHLTVRSVKDSYAPDEKPKFEIVVKNSGGSACKVDFGSPAAVLRITDRSGEHPVWASDDCPRGTGAVLLEVPASGETKRTVEWDRHRSVPRCATPDATGAATEPGTYRVEVKVAGATDRVEFVLNAA